MIDITFLGFILIPISIFCLLKDEEKIFYLMIFFAPFTASAIMNLDIGPLKYGLQTPHWFAGLWILIMLKKFIKKDIEIRDKSKKYMKIISFLWVIFLFSLSMPFILKWLNINIMVRSIKSWLGFVELNFSIYNITQFMYLSLVLVLTILFIVDNNSLDKIRRCIKTLILSSQFTVLWAFLQILTFYIKIPYPAFIFNNTIGLNLYDQAEGSIKRISSVSAEPSMYALFLAMIIPIITLCWFNDIKIIKRKYLNIAMINTYIVAILTTSTTAYVGILISSILLLIIFNSKYYLEFRDRKFYEKTKILTKILLIVSSVLLVCILLLPMVRQLFLVIFEMIFKKLSTGSGMVRKEALMYGLQTFLSSPILGVGVGSNRTYDLFSTLLSTTGILGFGLYIYLHFIILKESFKKFICNDNKEIKILSISLSISIITGFICMMLSIPDLNFTFYWIILSITIVLIDL